MDWSDEGIVLAVRRHGEAAAIADVLTAGHGRHLGLVHGGAGRKLAAALQPGNSVALHWRGRLPDHLGTYSAEPVRDRASPLLEDALGLAALRAACALVSAALPERDPHAPVHAAMTVLLDSFVTDGPAHWGPLFVRFELGLLQEMGYGLDLSRCAATGRPDDLVFVSPKSGRAVSRAAGAPYAAKLLPLPGFLLGTQVDAPSLADTVSGLRLSGFFLARNLLEPHGVPMPEARHRLSDLVARAAGEAASNRP